MICDVIEMVRVDPKSFRANDSARDRALKLLIVAAYPNFSIGANFKKSFLLCPEYDSLTEPQRTVLIKAIDDYATFSNFVQNSVSSS